jgi:hypothetical protein
MLVIVLIWRVDKNCQIIRCHHFAFHRKTWFYEILNNKFAKLKCRNLVQNVKIANLILYVVIIFRFTVLWFLWFGTWFLCEYSEQLVVFLHPILWKLISMGDITEHIISEAYLEYCGFWLILQIVKLCSKSQQFTIDNMAMFDQNLLWVK